MYGLSAQDISTAKMILRSWRMKWSRCEGWGLGGGLHSSSVLPSSRKYRSIVQLALLFLCLSTAKYWIMSFHTICPQASLKIHEWAILWGTGAIVCPSRSGTKDLTRNTWRGASVVISQTDLAEALVSASTLSNRGFQGNSASLQHVSSIQMTWWSL